MKYLTEAADIRPIIAKLRKPVRSITLSPGDVTCTLTSADWDGVSPHRALKYRSTSVLNPRAWPVTALLGLCKKDGEAWSCPPCNRIVLWRGDKRLDTEPEGFITFGFAALRVEKCGKIAEVEIDTQLAYVRKPLRGKGLGYHLAAHFHHWIGTAFCFRAPFVSGGGMKLVHRSSVYTVGGEVIARCISEDFELLKDLRTDMKSADRRELPLLLKDVESLIEM